jgi:hypothetical protein
MKKLKILGLVAVIALVASSNGCKKANPEPQSECFKGVVIGKIRSWGGGLAVSMEKSTFSSHQWRGYNNVVEVLNLDMNLAPNTTIYFNARLATEDEKIFAISSDGDESAKPIILASNTSTNPCNLNSK